MQVDAKRELGNVTMHYKVNDGAEQHRAHQEWDGGEVYGGDSDIYFHRVRGAVNGIKPGDEVQRLVHRRRQAVAVVHLHDGERLQRAGADHGRGGLLGQAGEFITEAPAYADRTKPNYLKYYRTR